VEPTSGEVTRLPGKLRRGRPDAETELLPLVYDHLHGLAARYKRLERPHHTLQATSSMNEAYLRLVSQQTTNWRDRAHFNCRGELR